MIWLIILSAANFLLLMVVVGMRLDLSRRESREIEGEGEEKHVLTQEEERKLREEILLLEVDSKGEYGDRKPN